VASLEIMKEEKKVIEITELNHSKVKLKLKLDNTTKWENTIYFQRYDIYLVNVSKTDIHRVFLKNIVVMKFDKRRSF